MRIFKNRAFKQWANAENLEDKILRQAVDEMGKGSYEANLGSGLYKKRIALSGKGKRGGYRTLIAFKKEENAFFVYGFSKNVRANIREREKKIYRKLAKDVLKMKKAEIQKMLDNSKLFEVY